ncbi:MAG: amidohydrolase [Pseudomonadota bacterium]
MDAVFFNGRVISMNPAAPRFSALGVQGDLFQAVGSDEELRRLAGPDTRLVDLEGRTVIPGLIETHGHLSYYSLCLALEDASPEENPRIEDLKKRLARAAAASGPGAWIGAWGYDDTRISDNRHLTRLDLDEAAPNNPVFVLHVSSHAGYTNSLALKMAGVGPETPDPAGGIIHRDENGLPSGLLLEPAAMELVSRLRPVPDAAAFERLIPLAAAKCHREGITSVHDAAVGAFGEGAKAVRAYQRLEAGNQLRLRVYLTMVEQFYRPFLDQGLFRGFGNKFLKLGAVKNFQDGSIQALTGALGEDYHNRPGYKGMFIMPQEALDAFVERNHGEGLQIAIHANGDGAIESVIQAFERAQAKHARTDARHMIIHCQMASEDHISRMKALGIIPSFFVNHVYYWGDRHLNLFLGRTRAERIDPLGSAIRAGLPFTLHADVPVTPLSPIFSMHNAVNRMTRNGVQLGRDQCITPYQALEAYTTNAAKCSFEEREKGRIEPGMLADFVVLSEDILATAPERIKDVKALKTFVGGELVYEAD